MESGYRSAAEHNRVAWIVVENMEGDKVQVDREGKVQVDREGKDVVDKDMNHDTALEDKALEDKVEDKALEDKVEDKVVDTEEDMAAEE